MATEEATVIKATVVTGVVPIAIIGMQGQEAMVTLPVVVITIVTKETVDYHLCLQNTEIMLLLPEELIQELFNRKQNLIFTYLSTSSTLEYYLCNTYFDFSIDEELATKFTIESCKYFESFDCDQSCDLCKLCDSRSGSQRPECSAQCANGIAKCKTTCKAGQDQCKLLTSRFAGSSGIIP